MALTEECELQTTEPRIPWNKGKTGIYSEETLKKMSDVKKGIPLSEEHKQKISESRGGYVRSKERIKTRQKNTRIKWVKWFKEFGYASCSECGYSKCFSAIDFHHRDPAEKVFGIGGRLTWAFNDKNKEKLLKEIIKCDVLCSNCHRELHSIEGE